MADMVTRFRQGRADFCLGALATYGAIWAVLEPICAFFDSFRPAGVAAYAGLVALSLAGGLCLAWEPKRLSLPMPAADSTFNVEFGNIFDRDGVIVIPVNEYFDGQLGDHVSETSLHGQFIQQVLGGQSQTFFDLTDQALANVAPEEPAVDRTTGKSDRYPIGTVARVDIDKRRFLLVVLSRTDLATLKASASVTELLTCLAGVWNGAREFSGGRPIHIPLIGSGLSGVGLPAKHLIEVMLTSFLYYTKESKVADEVTLVLQQEQRVRLRDIKRRWT